MLQRGVGDKTGRRMGHMPVSGAEGSLERLSALGVPRVVYPYERYRPSAFPAPMNADRLKREVSKSAMTASRRSTVEHIVVTRKLEVRLKAIGAERYHNKHPFHLLMNSAAPTKDQLRAWALNR